MLLFDCSLELDQIFSKNKLLYWFHFLQTQIGEANVILIATKIDILQKKLQNQQIEYRLEKINQLIALEIKKNNIKLQFHKFVDKNSKQQIYFLALNNLSIEAVGAKKLQKLLAEEYDSNQYAISSTLQHKDIWV